EPAQSVSERQRPLRPTQRGYRHRFEYPGILLSRYHRFTITPGLTPRCLPLRSIQYNVVWLFNAYCLGKKRIPEIDTLRFPNAALPRSRRVDFKYTLINPLSVSSLLKSDTMKTMTADSVKTLIKALSISELKE